MSELKNIAEYLPRIASERPDDPAIYSPFGKYPDGRIAYRSKTFNELNQISDAYSIGLKSMGLKKGTRVLLMVRPGEDLIALAFSLFKLGAVPVLIDPGMGVKNLLSCIRQSAPEVLIGIPLAQNLSRMFQRSFSSINKHITVGRSLFYRGKKLSHFRRHIGEVFEMEAVQSNDLAAILFTSGSTGPPKGVCYEHGQFMAQVRMLKATFQFEAGEIDLPMLPIFALFNPALGMTTVIPKMNPSRPAKVKPEYIADAIERFKVTNSFGSPILWRIVCDHCKQYDIKLPSLKRVLMAGAPVAPEVLESFYEIAEQANAFTPYGATEALPLTAMKGRDILDVMKERTDRGMGMCVGKPLEGIELRIDTKTSEFHSVGEILVSGEVVTKSYDKLPEATEKAKVIEDGKLWHRMGDMGYLDEEGYLWFCGRKSHKVDAEDGIYYSVCCESIFNAHEWVFRSALIGLKTMKAVVPAIVVELKQDRQVDRSKLGNDLLQLARSQEITKAINSFYIHPSFPVDVRHNAKINREELAVWARSQTTIKTILN